jgi:hypothetical protein
MGCFTGEKPPGAVVVAHSFMLTALSSSVLAANWSVLPGIGATKGTTRTEALPHVVDVVAVKGDGAV